VPVSLLIERAVTMRGFSLVHFLQKSNKAAAQELVTAAERLKLKLLIEKYPLSKFSAALAKHEEPFRKRKIVLLNQQ
jgi:hypothetical protein